MDVKLEHSTSICTTYIKNKGSTLLGHIINNLTEYTISTQNTKSKRLTDKL